jgi:hypothetical protein
LDREVLDGAAPSYAALQDWFHGAIPVDTQKAQVGTIKYRVHSELSDSSWKKMPSEYKKGLIKYFVQQEARVGEFQKSLRDPNKLKSLFALESAEMYDILRALIDVSYKPISTDLLAHLISQPSNRNYVDRFSVELLERLYKKSQRSLIANLAVERDNFTDLLVKTNVNGQGAVPKFIGQLSANCDSLKGLLQALGAQSSGKCTASGSALNLAGKSTLSEALKTVSGGGRKYATMFAGAVAADGPYGASGRPNLSIFAGKDLGAEPPPATPSTPSTPGGDPSVPTLPSTPGSDPWGLGALLGIDWDSLVSSFSLSEESSALMLAATKESLPRKPDFSCTEKGYTGMSLVLCQRYFSVMPKPQPKNSSLRLAPQAEGFNLDSSPAYSYTLVANHFSPVQNQGSEGACTAFGFAHSAEATLSMMGVKTKVESWDLWRRQGQQYYNRASIAAAKSMDFGGKRLVDAPVLTSLEAMKSSIAKGKAVYVGTLTGNNWYSPRGGELDCSPTGSEMGHAYSLQGYDDAKKVFIIKNSWGDSWGESGYYYLPYSCFENPGFARGDVYELNFN